MAEVDTDPFGGHESRTDESMGEDIPLITGRGGVPIWEPEREQETPFGAGLTQEKRLTNSYVDSLYKELSNHYSRTSDAIHYDSFSRYENRLNHNDKYNMPLTNKD